MTDGALVSVIVPLYNGAAYIGEALQSVQAQTYPHVEIIVIDDGSTDTGLSEIERCNCQSLNIIRQRNSGTGAARNRGVDAANGSLLAFLDQDDVWEPDKLARQVYALEREPTLDAVFGMAQQFHSPELDEEFRQRVQCQDSPIPGYLPSALLIRRASFDRIGRFGEQWQLVEWSDWFVRAIEQGLSMRLLQETVMRRRLHESNKGLSLRSFQSEYPRILKALLDRRRLTQ